MNTHRTRIIKIIITIILASKCFILAGQDPAFDVAQAYNVMVFPDAKKVIKNKIRMLLLHDYRTYPYDTMLYNTQTGLPDRLIFRHKEIKNNDTILSYIGEEKYYYTNNTLDSIVESGIDYTPFFKVDADTVSIKNVSKYDSTGRRIMYASTDGNILKRTRYIKQGDTILMITTELNCNDTNKNKFFPNYNKQCIDTIRYTYDRKNRLSSVYYSESNIDHYFYFLNITVVSNVWLSRHGKVKEINIYKNHKYFYTMYKNYRCKERIHYKYKNGIIQKIKSKTIHPRESQEQITIKTIKK